MTNKRNMENYFNRRVKPIFFKVGNLVIKEAYITAIIERKLNQ